MPQRHRHDEPGRLHHVMNRGVAKRVVFPDRAAKRRFLALIACSVRRGELRVVAVCVLDTHFHMLAGTPDGRIGYAMMRIMNAYSRYFNRRFKRDGSPFRGRFRSYPVLTQRYFLTLVRYIDFNAVKAKLATSPGLYAYGSARYYAFRRDGPAWLSRKAVEDHVCSVRGTSTYLGTDYARVFGHALTAGETEVVQRRLERGVLADDDLGAVEVLPPERIAAWMRRKARLADGLSPWAPIVGSDVVMDLVRQAELENEDLVVLPDNRQAWRPWPVVVVGLLHDAAGLGCEETARRIGCSSSTAGRRLRAHRQALERHSMYARLAGRLLRAALDETYPDGPPA